MKVRAVDLIIHVHHDNAYVQDEEEEDREEHCDQPLLAPSLLFPPWRR